MMSYTHINSYTHTHTYTSRTERDGSKSNLKQNQGTRMKGCKHTFVATMATDKNRGTANAALTKVTALIAEAFYAVTQNYNDIDTRIWKGSREQEWRVKEADGFEDRRSKVK